jgi:hypothetical protein
MDAQSGVRPKTGSGASASGAAGGGSGTASEARTTGARQKDDVSELVDQAKRTATETASSAGDMVRQRADDQYHRLGQRLDDIVKNLNQVADGLDKGGSPGTSNIVHGATRQVERVSGYVQGTSAEDVLSDANRYAKQHPWTVIIGGVIVGLAASRFVKAAMPSMGGESEGGSPTGSRVSQQRGAGYQPAV